MKAFTIILVSVTILILFGGITLLGQSSSNLQLSPSKNVSIITSETNYDWGEINYSKGNVAKAFGIKNTGTDILKLFNIRTSCHCTKARLIINNNYSPNFGMSDISSWVGEVPPNTEAQLEVIFDPTYHGPSGIGPITRYVSVETNDSKNSKLTFTTTGIVVK